MLPIFMYCGRYCSSAGYSFDITAAGATNANYSTKSTTKDYAAHNCWPTNLMQLPRQQLQLQTTINNNNSSALYEEIELKCHKIFSNRLLLLDLSAKLHHQTKTSPSKAKVIADLPVEQKFNDELIADRLSLTRFAAHEYLSPAIEALDLLQQPTTTTDCSTVLAQNCDNQAPSISIVEITNEASEIDDKLGQRQHYSCKSTSADIQIVAAAAVEEDQTGGQFCSEKREERTIGGGPSEFNVIDDSQANVRATLVEGPDQEEEKKKKNTTNKKEEENCLNKSKKKRSRRSKQHKSGSLKTTSSSSAESSSSSSWSPCFADKTTTAKSSRQNFSFGWLNLSKQFHEILASVQKYDLTTNNNTNNNSKSVASRHAHRVNSASDKRRRRSGRDHFMVMISYVRCEGQEYALDLKEALERIGVSVYLDLHEIGKGSDWQDSLNEAIVNCECLVPLVTPSYGKTLWTRRELKLADVLAKLIIPVNFLPPAHWPPKSLAIQFATMQYVFWLAPDPTNPNARPPLMTSSFASGSRSSWSRKKKLNNKWPAECVRNVSRQIKEALDLSAAAAAAQLQHQQQQQQQLGRHRPPYTCAVCTAAPALCQRRRPVQSEHARKLEGGTLMTSPLGVGAAGTTLAILQGGNTGGMADRSPSLMSTSEADSALVASSSEADSSKSLSYGPRCAHGRRRKQSLEENKNNSNNNSNLNQHLALDTQFPINLTDAICSESSSHEASQPAQPTALEFPLSTLDQQTQQTEQGSRVVCCCCCSSTPNSAPSSSCSIVSSAHSSGYIYLPEGTDEEQHECLQRRSAHNVSTRSYDFITDTNSLAAAAALRVKVSDKVTTTTTTNLLQQQQQQNYSHILNENKQTDNKAESAPTTKGADKDRASCVFVDDLLTPFVSSSSSSTRRKKSSFKGRAVKALNKVKRSLLPQGATHTTTAPATKGARQLER